MLIGKATLSGKASQDNIVITEEGLLKALEELVERQRDDPDGPEIEIQLGDRTFRIKVNDDFENALENCSEANNPRNGIHNGVYVGWDNSASYSERREGG
jgi:hypothetical protein